MSEASTAVSTGTSAPASGETAQTGSTGTDQKSVETKTPSKTGANGANGAQTAAKGEVEGQSPSSPAKGDKYSIKIDGKDQEFTLDELRKMASLSGGAQKRLQEAAEQAKAAKAEKEKIDGIMRAFQKGDFETLIKSGLSQGDIESLSIRYLAAIQRAEQEKHRIANLDPREREILERQQLILEREQRLNQAEEQHLQSEIQSFKSQIDEQIIRTLELLPESYRRAEPIAQLAAAAWCNCIEQGIKVTPEQVAAEILKAQKGLTRTMIDSAKEEEYGDFISEDSLKKLIKKAQKAAEDKAHPGVTAQPQVRDGKKKEAPVRIITNAERLRYGPAGRPDDDDPFIQRAK